MGEVLDGAITYIRQNPRATLGLSAIVVAITEIILVVTQFLYTSDLRQINTADPATIDSQLEVVQMFSPSIVGYTVSLVVAILGSLVLTGMLTTIVGRSVLGGRMGMREAWRQLRPRLGTLIVAALLVTGAILGALGVAALPGIVLGVAASGWGGFGLGMLGFLAWIPAAVWLYVVFALATPAIMLEGAKARAALGRSRGLVRGSWWRVFGILLLAWVLAGVIGGVINVPFWIAQWQLLGFENLVGAGDTGAQGAPAPPPTPMTALAYTVGAVGAIVAGMVVRPFRSGVPALLYVDLRMRREGLDLQLQDAAGVTRAPAAEPPSVSGGPGSPAHEGGLPPGQPPGTGPGVGGPR